MRQATRRNLANGAYVLAGLCCALGTGAYLALRNQPPEVVTVTEYRYLPGEKCVGIDVADRGEPVPGIPGVLERLLNRPRHHRPHGGSNGTPALPPLTCAPPEGPVTRLDVPAAEANVVPEPGTLALMALALPLFAFRKASA